MRRFFSVLILSVILLMSFSGYAFAASTIKYKIISEVSPDEIAGYLISCKHFYSVSVNGTEIIPPTQFPDNQTTTIELPKTNDNYTVKYYDQRTYTHSADALSELSLEDTFKGNKSKEIKFTAGFLWGGGHGLEQSSSGFSFFDVNTDASETAGESSVPVPVAVVVAAVGALAAAAGAGAAGGAAGSKRAGEESGGSTYKMCIYKDFGNKIKYNGNPVFVNARMVEVTPEGVEIDRPDLTQKIEIFSYADFLSISPAVLNGSYMSSSVEANAQNPSSMPKEAVISFKFTGEAGTFQNNIKFMMVGECYIEIDGGKLYALAASGRSFEQPYKLIDFMAEAEVSVNKMQEGPFDLTLGKDKNGNPVLIATDRAEKKPFDSFFDNYSCEIIAQNEKEYARTVFSVVLCHEGILPDFLGKPKEVCAYKDEKDEMKETLIAFRFGVWNDSAQKLDFLKPEGLQIDCSDEDGVYEVIGLDYELQTDGAGDEALRYLFKAEKSLPALEPVKGILSAAVTYKNIEYSNETAIELRPDLQQYEKDRKLEYERCLRILNAYMPERLRTKKIQELQDNFPHMGIKDLQLFRKNAWQIASRAIMQDKESYLKDEYWYDEAIATAELLVYIGDIALDVALAPFGGPITGFVVAQVKTSLLELITLYVKKGTMSMSDVWDFVVKRFVQITGQADGAFETPSAEKTKLLIAWLACYIIYRIMYHWMFDKEDDGTPKGLSDAIENGLLDFAGKGASIVLGEFTKKIAKDKGWDKYSIADKDQEITNDAVTSVTKTGLQYGDKAAAKLDEMVEKATKTLLEFVEKIKTGSISI